MSDLPLKGPHFNYERAIARDRLRRHTHYCDECRSVPGYCGVGRVWALEVDRLTKIYGNAKVVDGDGPQD